MFLRGEGWGEVAKDPLLDFSEISEKVVPYLNGITKSPVANGNGVRGLLNLGPQMHLVGIEWRR